MKRIAAVAVVFALGAFGCAGSVGPSRAATAVSTQGAHSVAVRAEAGSVWTSTSLFGQQRGAWEMPGSGKVEDLAVGAAPGGGYTVSFRRGGVAWRGLLDAGRTPVGPLQEVVEPVEALDADTATAQR